VTGDRLEIGRDPSVGLVLQDQLISRHHARITPVDGGAVAEDLGSLNGTFVNGDQIHSPTHLDPGDQVLVGVTVLQLRSADQIAAQPSAVRPVPPALAAAERRPDFIAAELLKEEPTALDSLLDVRTKGKARMAPLALFVLVVIVVLIYLATR